MKKILLLLSLICSLVANGQILTNYQGQIISKNGLVMGSPEGIVFVSNQGTSIDQVTLTFNIDEGKSILINWGDGNTTLASGTGANQSYTSVYTSVNTTYIIQLVGDLEYVKTFSINSETTVKLGVMNQFAKLERLERLSIINVNFTILNIDILSYTLKYCYITNGSLQGYITGNISLKYNLETFDIQNQPNNLTGSITGLANLVKLYVRGSSSITGTLTYLLSLEYIYLTGVANGDISNLTKLTYFGTTGNGLTGDITNLVLLTRFEVSGSGYIIGSISNLTLLSVLNVVVSNAITGDIAYLINLTLIQMFGNNTLYGNFSNLTKLTYLYIVSPYANITGSFINLINTDRVNLAYTYISNPVNLSSMTKLTRFSVIYTLSTVTSFSAPNSTAALYEFFLPNCNIDKFDFTNTLNLRGDLRIHSNPNDTSLILPATLTGDFTRIDAHGNALNQSSVDNLFKKIATYYITRTPTANLYIDVSGGTNAAPTGGSNNPDINAIDAKFSAAGKVFTILTN